MGFGFLLMSISIFPCLGIDLSASANRLVSDRSRGHGLLIRDE